jgi:hypothetical protein
MRMRWWCGLSVLCLASCEQEYSIGELGNVKGVPNPPALATPIKVDRITQVNTPSVDVLWVIDNSGSMLDEQRKLTRNFNSFIQFFLDSGLDWHMGVITVDVVQPNHSGKLRQSAGVRYITPETPDAVGVFNDMASVGVLGAGDESGLRATYWALTDPLLTGYNAGFYRDNATLHVITISDEDDYSADQPSVNEFIDLLTNLKPDPNMLTFSSIVGRAGCAAVEEGTRYLAVTQAVGGVEASVCEADWVPVLEQLGLLAAGMKSEFFLSELPVPGTITVRVIEEEVTRVGVDLASLGPEQTVADVCRAEACFGYTYDPFRNSLLFDGYFPSQLSEVVIRYELLRHQQSVDPAPVADDTDE